MTGSTSLGELQQLSMLAVARLGERAYGDAIRRELEEVAGRDVAVSTVYVTLVRLEDQGLVASEKRDAESGAGSRERRYFRLTAEGWAALRSARAAFERMWAGVPSR